MIMLLKIVYLHEKNNSKCLKEVLFICQIKLVFMKSITESSFSRSHHGKNGNNTFVIFSIVPNFMMKFAFFSHVRVWLKGLKHMR